MKIIEWSDLRLSVRMLRSMPGLAALATLSIAAGIGISTAAFAIMYGAFLKPLPVAGGERMVMVWDHHKARGYNVYISADEFAYRREHASSFEELAASASRLALVEVQGSAAGVVRTGYVTPNTFRLFGIPAALGRGLLDDDARPGAPPVVVLGDSVWRARLAADPRVVGRVVTVAGEARTVVGVMPPGVRLPLREDLWIPNTLSARDRDATARLILIGKLKSGVTLRAAEAELAVLAAQRANDENQFAHLGQRVIPFTRGIGGPEQELVLAVLLGALVLLLLVAAANVANLVLARNAARMSEIAVRSALGASRGQLVRLLLVESLVLCSVGAVLGMGGARAGIAWFTSAVNATSDLPWWADLSINPTVLAFVFLLTLLATAVVGLAPALKATRVSLAEVMKQGAPGIGGLRFGRLSAAMIIAEFAIAVAFMGAAGAVARGLLDFSFAGFGLPAEEVLVSQVYFGPAQVAEGLPREARRAIWLKHYDDSLERARRMADRLAALPGIARVSLASAYPGNELEPVTVEIEGATPGAVVRPASTRLLEIGAGYFETLDARLLAGRDFLPAERSGAPRVAIVNEPFVQRHFGGANPLGRRVRMAADDAQAVPEPWLEIIGVVRDLGVNPGHPRRADAFYTPLAPTNVLRVAVRAGGDPRNFVAAVHEVAQGEAPMAQVQWAVTLEEQITEVVAVFRRLGIALVAVGALALLLSAASLYAIVAFAVTQRTREIGIRVALGAAPRQVLQAVLRREVAHLAAGALAGVAGVAGMMQLLRQIPFDLAPSGPWLTIAFVASMMAAGLAACAIPARRALRIQPIEALRHE